MIITIDIANLKAIIEEEISRVADRSYSEDGTSLYDAIVKKSRDEGTVDRSIEESVSAVRSACARFLDLSHKEEGENIEFKFVLTERRALKKDVFYENLIRSTLVHLVVSRYLNMAQQDEYAKKYDELASLNIKMLVKELYGKMPPTRKEDQ